MLAGNVRYSAEYAIIGARVYEKRPLVNANGGETLSWDLSHTPKEA
jgi:hypothetical protein